MLFSIKKHLWASAGLAVVLTVTALGLKATLGLEWQLLWTRSAWRELALAIAVQVGVNGLIFLFLKRLYGQGFLRRCQALVDNFQGQSGGHFVASGALAASEELFFRGVLLTALLPTLGVGWAIVISALCFGLAHHIHHPARLRPFSLWAAAEGIILGTIYVYSSSLWVNVVLHAANDGFGFWAFAIQRRSGFPPLAAPTMSMTLPEEGPANGCSPG